MLEFTPEQTTAMAAAVSEHLVACRNEPVPPTDEDLRELWHDSWDTSEEHGAFQFARAVLARWGCPTPQPVDGEVAELAAWLQEEADDYVCIGEEFASSRCNRAADLLTRLAPQPIPVSERLPGPGDCDAEGRCWWGVFQDDELLMRAWHFERQTAVWRFACWLPAHALPLPAND